MVLGAGPWETTTADLSNYSGSYVEFRFTFASDSIISYDGWYIDDVGVVVDWFESNGSWTSDLISENEFGFAPTIDIDASIPDGAWATASLVDVNGNPLSGSFNSENQTFPVHPHLDSYRIRVEFGTTDHEQTPRIGGLHAGAVRVLNSAEGTNRWHIPSTLNHNAANISNPTLITIRISASSA